MEQEKNIDIVITWVDSNDPKHLQKINSYREPIYKKEEAPDDIAGNTRYSSVGEIFFNVASIIRFAPFVRKIFIITDQQNPGLDDFINKNFPDNDIPIEIIDHTVIFRGYEEYLPVFNSLAIETMMYRIPGLSEKFVYFCDDFFLIRPITPEIWFKGDKPVAYGYWHLNSTVKFTRWLSSLKKGHHKFKLRDSMVNASDLIHNRFRFWRAVHTPAPMLKSTWERLFNAHPEYIIHNIKHKFRDPSQFSIQSLFYTMEIKNGNCLISDIKDLKKDVHLYLEPRKDKPGIVYKQLDILKNNKTAFCCCMNSLDLCTEDERKSIFEWLCKLYNVQL